MTCGQRAPSWQKDAGKQQLGASSLLLLVLRHVVPSLPRPVDVPNWKYLKKKKGGGGKDAIFLVRMVRTSKQNMENCFTTIKAVISPTAPLQDSPPQPCTWRCCHRCCPSLAERCSTAPASPDSTCPTSRALQNSTSAYTFVLIFPAPTLGCIPAPFLINPISHMPGFVASPMPSCMLAQVPWSLVMFLLKSAAKLPYWSFTGARTRPLTNSLREKFPLSRESLA